MKKIFIILTLIFMSFNLFAQQNLSVPLNDSAYNLLEYIQIRNYVGKLHNARPYSASLIIDTLYDALDNPLVTKDERLLIQDTIDRLSPYDPTVYIEEGTFWQNAGIFSKTGVYRYEEMLDNTPINVEVGTNVMTDMSSNFNDPSISGNIMLGAYIQGDLTDYFSYKVNMDFGVLNLDFSAYAPNTFTRFWGGYLYDLSDPAEFSGKTEKASAAIQFAPEFAVSFFDHKLDLSFSRIRHDWGTGNGNLMLSKTAQPFTAAAMYLHPVDFASLSFMTGALEFTRDDGTISPQTYQNSYSAFMAELFFGEYAYAGLLSSVVYPKRFELTYMMPGIIPFFGQNTSGDFDNLLMGISLGANVPGYASFYYNLFMDELNLSSDDFFHMDRNMYSYQAGIKASIPNSNFTVFNIQYTKLEPYMYTHPGTETPWYDDKMHTNYVNHGENIGYNLQPNSDELKITATAVPYWYLKTTLSYSLVRHGVKAFQESVDKLGNNIDDALDYGDSLTPGDPSDNTDTKKYFLTDGTYEWIHSLGIQAELDMRFVKDIPLSLILGYTLSYTHHTEPDVLNASFKPVNNNEFKNTWGNYFSVSMKLW